MKYFHPRRRWLTSAAMILGLVLASIAVTPGPANATAYVCSSSHGAAGSLTCMGVTGTGLRVEKVVIDHHHGVLTANYCEYRGKFWGTQPSGGTVTYISNLSNGCITIAATAKFTINRDFKHGTKVYGQLYHDGSWAPGKPAATIKR